MTVLLQEKDWSSVALRCKMTRVTTFCKHFDSGNCRSCEWITVPYADQLRKKESILIESLGLKANDPRLEATMASLQTGFRNRAKMTVTGTVENPCIGLIGTDTLDQGRELLDCPIHHPRLNEVIQALPQYIRDYQLIPYRINERKGELKGLILFYSPGSNELYLRFILRSRECVSRIRKLLPKLQEQFPFLTCVSANLQPIPHAHLDGPEEIILSDRPFIRHQLGEWTFQLSPQAFVQTNADTATRLYQTAADWVATIRPVKMLELFCGQGAFSFFASKSADSILGIEINAAAVDTANRTAKTLGLDHIRFECLQAKNAPHFGADLILVNPPRRGLAESVQLILDQQPESLIYSSCSHESLARDLQNLSNDYSIEKIRIFDLFPHTEHFETLVLLRRK
jgi:23S rRNA (uracil747-C5)-methyltransferase